MFGSVTRLGVVQGWIAVVILAAVTYVALGRSIPASGGTLVLVLLCLAPAAVVWLLWPAEPALDVEQRRSHPKGRRRLWPPR